ncbi:RNA polymerase sigma factor [Chitinophaga sp. NPDC101104]|uniref:RNA polymerase sigma factor n=1 Tax=Chitinophaga sp. NPDC101104 TaxID=3390561 RepID=UPI003D03EA5E
MSNGIEHMIGAGGIYAGLPDRDLWNKVKEGDRAALDYIYRQHFRPLYGYGMKVHADETLVQDAIHDVFVSIWQGRGGLSATDSIRFYLLSSLKRRILRHLGKQLVLPDDDGAFYDAPSASPEDELIGKQSDQQRRARLAGVMAELPPRQQEVLYLRYYHGLDTRETADIMSLSVNSAYVLLSKALKYLKDNSDKIVFALAFFGNGGLVWDKIF